MSKLTNESVGAVVLGEANGLEDLGNYGAAKVFHIADARLANLDTKAYAKAIVTVALQENASTIIFSNNITSKAVAPRVAASLKAGLVAGAIALPSLQNGFVVKKSVFSGKAFAFVEIKSATKVISITPNSIPVEKNEGTAQVISQSVPFSDADFAIKVESVQK